MRYGELKIASAATVAGLAAMAGLALTRLPPGTQLPVHWNAGGAPDRFADAGHALFTPVAVTAGLALLMAALPRLEPMQHRLDRSAPLFRTAWAGLLALMAVVELAVAAPAFDLPVTPALVPAAMGLFLVALGNMLPKSRPGFFVGIRTPWTLTDPDNWVATHRFGARCFIAGGFTVTAAALFPIDPHLRSRVIAAALAIAVVPPVIYSWWHWRRAGAGA
jgi:uncharacterized membrane protein